MKRFSAQRLKQVFPKIYATKRLVFERSSYLYETGWFESLQRGYPCKPNGEELPWMNYAVISFLQKRLTKSMNLFEYGSGFSTIFYSRFVNSVTAVEHNPEWLTVIKDLLPANANVIKHEKIENDKYCRAITSLEKKFDVLVVDGFDRVNCIIHGLSSLTEEGVMILDDSRRTSYNKGISYAKDRGFKSLEFEGFKPTGIGLDKTTVFYRDKNCFHI